MSNDLTTHSSDFFDVSHGGFFEKFLPSFFEDFKGNMVKTDIHETAKEYLLEAELPGIPKENIQVDYNDGLLTIKGNFKEEKEEKDKKGVIVKSERSYNSVCRQFNIKHINKEKIKAEFKDGILKVTLPKIPGQTEQKTTIPIN